MASGKYLTVYTENFGEFVKAAGVPEDLASMIGDEKPAVEFTVTDTQLTVKIEGAAPFEHTYIFGKETEVIFGPLKYLETIVKTEKGYSSTLKFEGKTGQATLIPTGEGLEETLVLDGITAKRRYKKL